MNLKLIYRYWATWSNTGDVQRITWLRQMFARASRITSALSRIPQRQLIRPWPHNGTGGSMPSGIYWAPGFPHHPQRVPGSREPMAFRENVLGADEKIGSSLNLTYIFNLRFDHRKNFWIFVLLFVSCSKFFLNFREPFKIFTYIPK